MAFWAFLGAVWPVLIPTALLGIVVLGARRERRNGSSPSGSRSLLREIELLSERCHDLEQLVRVEHERTRAAIQRLNDAA